jgi:hypothetical protein
MNSDSTAPMAIESLSCVAMRVSCDRLKMEPTLAFHVQQPRSDCSKDSTTAVDLRLVAMACLVPAVASSGCADVAANDLDDVAVSPCLDDPNGALVTDD